MTVSILSGDRQVKAGTFDAVENLSHSTATARQRISTVVPITTISGGTATSGPNVNGLFTLPGATATEPPVEGMQKIIMMLATGPAESIAVESMATGFSWGPFSTSSDDQRLAAPTGAFVFTIKGHYLAFRYINAQWWLEAGYATLGTVT